MGVSDGAVFDTGGWCAAVLRSVFRLIHREACSVKQDPNVSAGVHQLHAEPGK